MRPLPASAFLLSSAAAALALACSAAPSDEVASAESAQTTMLSCRAKREAAAARASETRAQGHWRYLLLGVMQPVAGVPSIRERFDVLPDDDPLGRRLDVFAFAKSAVGADGLLSLERLVSVMQARHGVTLALDAFETNGTYTRQPAQMSQDAGRDFRATLWLAKHVFATAGIGVTEADAEADAERAREAASAWKTVTLPLSASDGWSTLEALATESKTGNGRFNCGTWEANHLVSLARAADAAYGQDGKTSFSELAIHFSKTFDATITLEPWSITYAEERGRTSSALTGEMAFRCAHQLFRAAARERAGLPPSASPGVALGMTRCDTIDLLALQGNGSRFTGSTATATMGQKQYEIVMLRASVLQEPVRKLLCLEPGDELKLYVPYGEHAISECALVNGVYTASKQGLTGFGYTDNWAAE